MTSRSPSPPALADDEGLAETRVRFLTAEPVPAGEVRGDILASWWRSREFHVPADRIELPYISDPDLDTPLARSADPVLRRLAEQLDGQPISIVLTDPTGLILTRLTPDADLERHLDRVRLAPGFSYAEQFVGTNGIGTALEGGRAMHVFGHEHYAEKLEDLACAGVPIRHPVTGKTVGALDLTCWRKDAGPLLITLAKSTTEQIRHALLTDTGKREMELLHAYLRACRRTGGLVFALNNDIVMMNDLLRTALDPADQQAVLLAAAEGHAGRRGTTVVDLPSGTKVRVSTHQAQEGGRLAGVVVQVKLVESSPARPDEAVVGTGMVLPGLVGSGPLWLRTCAEIVRAWGTREWLVLEGEPGVGKLALLRAVHQRGNAAGGCTVLDARDAGRNGWLEAVRKVLPDPSRSLFVRHVEALDPLGSRALFSELQRVSSVSQRAWVAVTCCVPPEPVQQLLRLFPRSVEVPPLRLHLEDVPRLVPFLLARLGCGGKLTCSPQATQLLSRWNWPGNVEQLLQTLKVVVAHRRTGVIQPGDLPPELWTASRRRLTPLESLERDAIVRCLQDAQGNKTDAARALGVSRATIYRKIREYGILALDE